ncbi:MAG: glycosyltransferase [Anaerolineae bacterium]|nr:glycosyltransferase [Anaerolineae bacterium]
MTHLSTLHQGNLTQVAVIEWEEGDGITEVINDELNSLGYSSVTFQPDQPIPCDSGIVFIYGPYGKLLPVLHRLNNIPHALRPVSIYWNTEGLPDLQLPWPFINLLSAIRSGGERWLDELPYQWARHLTQTRALSPIFRRMMRFRYLGDLRYAYKKGLIDLIADTSAIYAHLRSHHGLPTLFAPWGATQKWYDDLGMERDIDVLWMGKHGSYRRRRILYQVQRQLEARGVNMYIADNEQNPFIFGETRTEYLNRAKITLNITRTWYDDNFMRFAMAAPNGSLVVSETLLQHCPQFEPGIHYIAAPVERLADTILVYLQDDERRLQITDNAYQLVRTQMTLRRSMQIMMEAAANYQKENDYLWERQPFLF